MKRTIIIFHLLITSSLFGQKNALKLNHFYIVVNAETFQDIKESKALSSIINIDKGLPYFKPIDTTCTTVYLRCENTYIEIMGPNNKFKEEIGSFGIGFSWDSETPKDTIFESRTKPNCNLDFRSHIAYWAFETGKTPWYTAYYSNLKGSVGIWYSFYHPMFLTQLNKKDYTSFKRNYYLKNAYNKKKSAIDVSEINLSCSKEDYEKITNELDCFYVESKYVIETTTSYSIDGIKLNLNLVAEKSELKSFCINTRKSQPQNFTIGDLNVEGSIEKLIFEFKEAKH